MKRRVGLPEVGRPTMLGLNLAKPFEFKSWLSVLPTTKATTPKKQPCIATSSPPCTTSHELSQLNTLEPLDKCLQSNGAMQPFHTLFERSVSNFATVDPKNEGVTYSSRQLQIPCPSDTTTTRSEGCDLTPSIQPSDSANCMLEGTNQSTSRLPAPSDEQASSFTTLPPLLSDEDEIVPFSALFPDHLLSDQVEDVTDTINDTVPFLALPSLCPLIGRPLSYDSQVPFDELLGGNFATAIKAHHFSLLTDDTPSEENNGRTSPHPSTASRDSFSSLFDTPNSSRRSSWATSISTHLGDDDSAQSTLGEGKPTAESDQSTDDIELINEYHHYNQLIELGDPQNPRDRDFISQQPIEERYNEVALPEKATRDVGDPGDDARGARVSDDSKTSITEAGSDAQQGRRQADVMQTESIQSDRMPSESMHSDTQLTLESESKSTPPSTPAEAAAWAHSYCDADPESVKLKVLTDAYDREYVLYHDCFHCVPIELAPEFADVFQEEEYDDGYGSATETCDAGIDGTKLGTIPEEENEG